MANKLEYLEGKAKAEVRLDQDLLLLTILSSIIASYAIKMDNIYILIGSMLVSPLFDPVISAVVFLMLGKFKEFFKAIRSLLIAISIGVLSSVLFWVLMKVFNNDFSINTLLPIVSIDTLFIAVLMGVVGTLLWIWPKSSNTSAGVAIAISLVPPIAYFTFHLVMGMYGEAIDSLFVFMVNLLGIFIGSLIILIIYSKGKFKTRL